MRISNPQGNMSSLFRRRISNPPERLSDSPLSRKYNISQKLYTQKYNFSRKLYTQHSTYNTQHSTFNIKINIQHSTINIQYLKNKDLWKEKTDLTTI